MLSRTAESLFWLNRYVERAGNVARGLFVTERLAGMARSVGAEGDEWRGLLVASGGEEAFAARYDAVTQDAVVHWLVLDGDNPSSIVSCLEAARRNARAVRTALTVDMWEALNNTWNELHRRGASVVTSENLPEFLDWVRERVMLFNGAAADTMMRNEGWLFAHLGTMLERADNTARLLDVKHHLLAPAAEGAVDFVQWQGILRSVSALRAYHHVYRERLQPRHIAEFMILRPELPRSLVACHSRVSRTLDVLATGQGGRRGECHRLAGELEARLRYGRIDAILRQGLHAFLTDMIECTARLGMEVEAFYIRG